MIEELKIVRYDRSRWDHPPSYRASLEGLVGWHFVRSGGPADLELNGGIGTTISAFKDRFPSALCYRNPFGYDGVTMNDEDWMVLELMAERRESKDI